ncbi:MAG: hypothetical protein KTR33_13865 [Gammaproteobacteria bacterium]|nr:hypothetical protein [Gammaproteobacteria bacterium]
MNLLADALNRQGNLNSDPIDLSQFGDIQSDIDTSNINFTSPNFSGLPGLQQAPLGSFNPNTPNVQTGIGQTPSLQNVLPNVDVQGQINTGGVNQLPTNIDQFRGDVEQSVFDRGRRLLDPIFSDQERSINQRLATQGLPISGEAADRDLTRFEDARNRAFVELADQSVITGGSQASRALADQLATQGQQFGQAAAQGQFANQAAGQQFGQGLAGGQFTNSAAQQAFDQAFARGNFANQSQNQLFGQQLQGIGFNNQTALQNAAQNQDIRSQLFNEGIAGASAQNAAAAQNLALQQQLLQNQNAARSQGLNEQSVVRQNQFNELASLLGLQQVQAPTFQNFIQPGQVDTLGAFSLNQQAQQQAFQAENSRNNAALGGLFGLGSSALLGPLAGIFGG